MGTVSERWKKGSYEEEIRITVRCTEDEKHAKVLRFDGTRVTFDQAVLMAAVFDGTSDAYIFKSNRACIGVCAICGNKLTAIVDRTGRAEHAQHQQPINKPERKPRKGSVRGAADRRPG
jgi:hypothetical protein